ncbi:hypothetical protein K502DRAFT_286749, partial [Neoconidiobolus thromboides FSU 785]
RWQNLFLEYFIENQDEMSDDMLFFVKKLNIQDLSDPVFVKRRPKQGSLPGFEETILWKETFFLNLIVQLNCKLRVSICKRGIDQNKSNNNGNSGPRLLKMCVKRVYALPSRSRGDLKERQWECSYPLIYYAVEDHEDMFENLVLGEGEHLCVELLCSLSNDSEQDILIYSTTSSDENNIAFLSKRPQNTVSLFQGAATFKSLLTVLRQKLALKSNKKSKVAHQFNKLPEYIIMRGPEGKGHAQVAMTFLSSPPNNSSNCLNNDNNNDEVMVKPPTSFLQSLKRLSLSPLIDKNSEPPLDSNNIPSLINCSITFVNIPWTSIIQ